MKRKAMAMLLAGALAIMTAACGQKGAAETQGQTEVQTEAQETATAEESAKQEPETQEASAEADEAAETATEAAAETEAAETGGAAQETAAGYEDNFAVDSAAAAEFGRKVKDAVSAQDLEGLAALAAYPLYVGTDGGITVNSADELVALGAEKVFTPELSEAVGNADETALEPSMAGFVLSGEGSANIIFGVVDGQLAIKGINY